MILLFFILLKKSNLSMFTINIYDKIELKLALENIKVIKGNNTIMKFPNDNYLLISCYEYDNNKSFDEQDYDDNIYNTTYINYKEDFSILIIDIHNFNIISKVKNNYPYIDIVYYTENIFIALDTKGIIHKIEFDKYQQILLLIDQINCNNNFGIYNLRSINLTKTKKNIILKLADKITNITI